MLLEAAEYLLTACPPWARKLGYLSESIAIRHRARRCRAAWADHLIRTKSAILAHCPDGAEKIVILGAGHCRDIPLEDLSRRCRRLVLVDAVRPLGLRLPPNTEFLTRDIHGLSQRLFEGQSYEDRGAPLREFEVADYIVSVNLISQLPILPLRYRVGLGLPVQDGLALRIQRDHVADLRALSGRVLLIGDARRIVRNADGNVQSDEDLTADLPLPEAADRWPWSLVPPGESGDGRTVETEVRAWRLGPDVADGQK